MTGSFPSSQVIVDVPPVINWRFVYGTCAVVALGGILFGFDLVIISGTVPFFSRHFALDETATGLAVGCINIGAALGAMCAGKLSDALGRKKTLLLCSCLFAVTGIATGWAPDFATFLVARLCSGVAVGAAALLCPVYIAELAPASLRGRLVTFYQLAIVTGLLLAYLSNYLLLNSGENNWRWMFSSQALPSILFFFGLFLVPESPRWLIRRNRDAEATNVLTIAGGTEYAVAEVASIRHSFSERPSETITSLFRRDVRHIVVMGIFIAIFSQAVGQNSLFSYAPILFQNAGFAPDTSFLQSVIIGLVNFVFTFIAIGRIERTGRKKLLQIGSLLLALDAAALGLSFYYNSSGYVTLALVLAFIAIYASTLGPVTWVLLSELFPNRIRSHAMSAATLSLWIANFFTTASFPVMKEKFGLPFTFFLHAAVAVLSMLYVTFSIPETRGKSLEQIEGELMK